MARLDGEMGSMPTVLKFAIFGFIFMGVLLLLIGCFYVVSAGERGVLLTWGNPEAQPKTEGLHFKVPIMQKVVIMDIKTQKYESDASAASQDLQIVSTKIAVNHHLDSDSVVSLYQEIGIDYNNRVIQPAVQEVVKASTAQFTAEELITKRAEVKEKIKELLRERLNPRGILVEDISITNFDFSAEFNTAIENKVVSSQLALKAENDLNRIKVEAQQKIVQAEGDSKARILNAQAEAQAIQIQAQAIQSQGGKDYVQLKAIEKWSGNVPVYSMGGAIPFINIPMASTPTTQ